MLESLMPIILKSLWDGIMYALDIIWNLILRFWQLWALLILLWIAPFFIKKFKNRDRRNYFKWGYIRRRGGKPETPEEEKLGNLLRGYGWNVRHQQWDGYKHIDIAIPEAKMNIEVDGSQHNLNSRQALSDQQRDYYSEQKGFKTTRVPNSLLRDEEKTKEFVELLDRELKGRIKK